MDFLFLFINFIKNVLLWWSSLVIAINILKFPLFSKTILELSKKVKNPLFSILFTFKLIKEKQSRFVL